MAEDRIRLVGVEGGPSELSLLFTISQILDSSLDLRAVVEPEARVQDLADRE